MRDFYIAEYTDDGQRLHQMRSSRAVIDYSIEYNAKALNQTPNETLLNIVAALLERAAINPQDMLELADLLGHNVEKF